MYIIPAIDIRGGKCVRLYQGDYKKETVYFDDPVDVAKIWQDKGAKILHVVDLDGAKEGKLVNFNIVKNIVKGIDIPIEFGGGIREIKDIGKLKDIGVVYPIIGTKGLFDEGFVMQSNDIMNGNIIVSVDVKHKKVVMNAWLGKSCFDEIEWIKKIEKIKVKRIIYTDVLRDGTCMGINIEKIKEILDNTKNVCLTVAGGIGSNLDIELIKEINDPRIWGVIAGKSLYEEKIDFNEVEWMLS